jgi:hypothetical protein
MHIAFPINLFTLAAICIVFAYSATHMGAKEHEGWFGSGQMFIVVALAVVLFCIGCDPFGIWHMLSGGH